ncbi:hypothetical protein KY342_00940 [Candidatus Woesearchaeota archaeon]|nr:hypothetical protein [Candidatus Woesearchaeota archaeon]
MERETSQNKMYMRIAATARQELGFILRESDIIKRFHLLSDFQNRTNQCVEDCVRENIPMCQNLYYADIRAKAEIQKFYHCYSGILDKLGIEEPDYRKEYDDGLNVIIGETKQ